MIDNKVIRQWFLIISILSITFLLSYHLVSYLGGILGALVIYILIEPLYEKLKAKNWGEKTAATFLIFLSTVVILIPVGGIILLLSSKVSSAFENKESIKNTVTENLDKLEQAIPYDLSGLLNKKEIGNFVSNLFSDLASGSLTLFVSVGILYLLLYFMLTESKVWTEKLQVYIPLKKDNISFLAKDLKRVAKANAIGVPVVAILQGFVAVIGYYIFGVENPWFWFAVTAIGSMLPFIGTALGIVPVCLLLLSQGDTGSAIGIALYGAIAVGATDNLFRLVVQKRIGDIHPLVTLFGVLVGIPLFGFLGLIFGPIIVSTLLLLFQIYRKEYSTDKNII